MPILFVTRDEQKKYRQAMEEKSNKERLAIRMEEKKKQAQMTEEHLATLEEVNRAYDLELEALEQKLLEQTKLKQHELLLQSKESMITVGVADARLRDMGEKRTQKYLEDRKMEIEERKRKLEATQRKLRQIRNKISEEQQLLLEINSQGHRERLEMMEKHEAERRAILEAHKQNLLQLEKEKKEILERRSELLNELQNEHLESERAHAKQIAEARETSMGIQFRLVSDSGTEERHKDYRSECFNVVLSFQTVQSEFGCQESYLIGAIDQIKLGLDVTYLPDLTNIPDSLRSLSNELQRLTVTSDMRQTKQDCLRISGTLRTSIISLDSKLATIVNNGNQLDQVTSRRLKAEIGELYQTAKRLMEELDDLIQKFNIAPINLVQIGIQQNLQQILSNALTFAPPPVLPGPVQSPPFSYPEIGMELGRYLPDSLAPQIQNNEQSEVEIIAEG